MKELDEKYHRVACRICGGEMLYPKKTYRKEDLIGWECKGTLPGVCRERMKMKKLLGM